MEVVNMPKITPSFYREVVGLTAEQRAKVFTWIEDREVVGLEAPSQDPAGRFRRLFADGIVARQLQISADMLLRRASTATKIHSNSPEPDF